MHFNVAAEVVETTHLILIRKLSASKTIAHRARLQRKWGGRDRRTHAEQCYRLIRHLRYWMFISTGQQEDINASDITPPALWACWAAMQLNDTGVLPTFDTLSDVELTPLKTRLTMEVSDDIKHSVPSWMYALLVNEYGEKAPELAKELNEPASVFLRVNTQKTTLSEVSIELEEHSISFRPRDENAIEILDRANLANSQIIQKGLVEIQDLSSQQIAPFIGPTGKQRIIDACAGAGGKALHLSNLMKGKGSIIALDNHKPRLEELKKRAKRNNIHNIETRLVDSGKTFKRLANSADHVLLDVPCSGSGVWRRKPESKWFIDPEGFQSLLSSQRSLLDDYQTMVKPGGFLIYATCSVFKQENMDQIDSFIERSEGKWQLDDTLVIQPTKSSGDGFFAAKLKNVLE